MSSSSPSGSPIDRSVFARLAAGIPDDRIKVAESGIRGPQDVTDYVAAGADAILVGEALVTGGDPTGAVRDFVAAGADTRTAAGGRQ